MIRLRYSGFAVCSVALGCSGLPGCKDLASHLQLLLFVIKAIFSLNHDSGFFCLPPLTRAALGGLWL